VKEDLVKVLKERYPEVIPSDYHQGWPEDGWFNILDAFFAALSGPLLRARTNRDNAKKYLDQSAFWTHEQLKAYEEEVERLEAQLPKLLQVKEKFGTLRVYFDRFDQELGRLVEMAEHLSAVTCEWCGAPGTLHPKGWWKTLCEGCQKERQGADKG
jgi:hypothetical protein